MATISTSPHPGYVYDAGTVAYERGKVDGAAEQVALSVTEAL